MKYLIFPFTLALLFSSLVFSQTVVPAPEATPEDDGQVVRISTSLVQMDVAVTDKDGKPITDLRQDEIEIYQNDKKQEITNLSFVAGGVKNTRTDSGLPASLRGRNIKADQIRRTIVLVVDDLTLSFESTYWVRKAVQKFIDTQMQEGDLVAVVRTSAGIGSLQQFTTDKRQLLAAADKIKYGSAGAPVTLFYPSQTNRNSKGSDRDRKPESEKAIFRENIFAAGSLGALNYVLKGMKDLPGRKSVMLLSEGLPLFFLNSDKRPKTTGIYASLKRLVDLANRSSVVIYGIDPVGLSIPGEFSTSFFDSDRRDSLRILSEETGGFAVLNQNDMNKGMDRVLKDQSYYLLGYQPDEDTFSSEIPKYNQVKITTSRPGAEVRYRHSFMGFSEENIKAAAPSAKERMVNALMSPFGVNEITLYLNTLFTSDAEKRPLLRSVIHVGPGDLIFLEQPDGKYKAAFDLAAVVVGDGGTVVDEMTKEFTVEVDRAEYDLINKNGFVYDFTLSLRSAGAYQARVVIRDHESDKIGSANQFVDVPNFKKERLLLSSPFLENVADERSENSQAGTKNMVGALRATATREFRSGTVLKFAYSIFNAKMNTSRSADLTYQPKIFYNGKLIYTGNKMPLVVTEAGDYRSLETNGTITLSSAFKPGEYILLLTVTDEMRKGDKGTADQFIQFEIVD